MQTTHNRPLFALPLRHKRAAKQVETSAITAGVTTMLLAFITARLRAKRAFVWKPALTLTDPRIVSELTGSFN